MKRCARCGEAKPITEFSKDKGKKGGFAGYCKPCNREHCAAYYGKHGERIKQKSRTWAVENRDRHRENLRRYYRSNMAAFIERAANWQANNRARRREIVNRYDAVHAAEKLARSQLRKARQRNAVPAWADIEAIKQIYRNCPPGHHVDHIIPLVAMRDGLHIACGFHCEANLQYLTAEENVRKGPRMPAEFLNPMPFTVTLPQGATAT